MAKLLDSTQSSYPVLLCLRGSGSKSKKEARLWNTDLIFFDVHTQRNDWNNHPHLSIMCYRWGNCMVLSVYNSSNSTGDKENNDVEVNVSDDRWWRTSLALVLVLVRNVYGYLYHRHLYLSNTVLFVTKQRSSTSKTSIFTVCFTLTVGRGDRNRGQQK